MYLRRSAGIAAATERDTPKTSNRTSRIPGWAEFDMSLLAEGFTELGILLVSPLVSDPALLNMSLVSSDGTSRTIVGRSGGPFMT